MDSKNWEGKPYDLERLSGQIVAQNKKNKEKESPQRASQGEKSNRKSTLAAYGQKGVWILELVGLG